MLESGAGAVMLVRHALLQIIASHAGVLVTAVFLSRINVRGDGKLV
jgi:hypothetical protein